MRGIQTSMLIGLLALTLPAQAMAQFRFAAEDTAGALNDAARALELDIRFAHDECETGIQTVCKVSSDPVAVLATADAPSDGAREVTIIFVSDGDQMGALRALTAWGALIAAVDPELDAGQRGKIITTLLPAVEAMSDERTVVRKVRYSVTASEYIGIWFSAISLE